MIFDAPMIPNRGPIDLRSGLSAANKIACFVTARTPVHADDLEPLPVLPVADPLQFGHDQIRSCFRSAMTLILRFIGLILDSFTAVIQGLVDARLDVFAQML